MTVVGKPRAVPVERDLIRLPPYHRLGGPRVRLPALKRIACALLGHTLDVGGPVMRCRRCGETAAKVLLTM